MSDIQKPEFPTPRIHQLTVGPITYRFCICKLTLPKNYLRAFEVTGGTVSCSENSESPVPRTHPQLRRYTGTDTLPSCLSSRLQRRPEQGRAAQGGSGGSCGPEGVWTPTLANGGGQHQAIHRTLLNCLLGKGNRI